MADDTSQPLERLAQQTEQSCSVIDEQATRIIGTANIDARVASLIETSFTHISGRLDAFKAEVEQLRTALRTDASYRGEIQQLEAAKQQAVDQSNLTRTSLETEVGQKDSRISGLEAEIDSVKREMQSTEEKLKQEHQANTKALEEANQKERQSHTTALEQALKEQNQRHDKALTDVKTQEQHEHKTALVNAEEAERQRHDEALQRALEKKSQEHTKAQEKAQNIIDDLRHASDKANKSLQEAQAWHQQELEGLQQELQKQTQEHQQKLHSLESEATRSAEKYSQVVESNKIEFDGKSKTLQDEYLAKLEARDSQHQSELDMHCRIANGFLHNIRDDYKLEVKREQDKFEELRQIDRIKAQEDLQAVYQDIVTDVARTQEEHLCEQEAKLRSQKKYLEEQERSLDAKKEQLGELGQNLKDRARDLEDREEDFKHREESLLERSRQVSAQIAALKKQHTLEVAALKAKLDQQQAPREEDSAQGRPLSEEKYKEILRISSEGYLSIHKETTRQFLQKLGPLPVSQNATDLGLDADLSNDLQIRNTQPEGQSQAHATNKRTAKDISHDDDEVSQEPREKRTRTARDPDHSGSSQT